MQNIKLLVDNSQSVDCIICLFNYLYIRFQTLRDDPRLWVVHALEKDSVTSCSKHPHAGIHVSLLGLL